MYQVPQKAIYYFCCWKAKSRVEKSLIYFWIINKIIVFLSWCAPFPSSPWIFSRKMSGLFKKLANMSVFCPCKSIQQFTLLLTRESINQRDMYMSKSRNTKTLEQQNTGKKEHRNTGTRQNTVTREHRNTLEYRNIPQHRNFLKHCRMLKKNDYNEKDNWKDF